MQIDELYLGPEHFKMWVHEHPQHYGEIEHFEKKSRPFQIRYYYDQQYQGTEFAGNIQEARQKLEIILQQLVMKKETPFQYLKRYESFVTEKVLGDEELKRAYPDNYFRSQDIKTHGAIRATIRDLKDLLKSLDYHQIKLTALEEVEDDNGLREMWCKVSSYGPEIDQKLKALDAQIAKFKDEDIRTDLEADDLAHAVYTAVKIERDNFNRVHTSEGYPQDLRGIGLGYKLYQALLQQFNYLSSDSGTYTSLYAQSVWNKLRKDPAYYTFLRDKKILCVLTTMPEPEMIPLLEDFYQLGLEYTSKKKTKLDPTFLQDKAEAVAQSRLSTLL